MQIVKHQGEMISFWEFQMQIGNRKKYMCVCGK